MSTPKHVLFVCTGNSARSVLAEALLNKLGGGRFVGHSAGSQPAGVVRAGALRRLRKAGIPTEGLRSKSWDEFAGDGAVGMDFIVTVCDNAANEACPYWPGHPATAHWGLADPAAVEGPAEEVDAAYDVAFDTLTRRIEALVALPLETLDEAELKRELERIGSL